MSMNKESFIGPVITWVDLSITRSQIICISGKGGSGKTSKLLTMVMDKVIADFSKLQDDFTCMLITSLSLVEILDKLYRFRERYTGWDLIFYLDKVRVINFDGATGIIGLLNECMCSGVTDIFMDDIDSYPLFIGNSGNVELFKSYCIDSGINFTYTKAV